MASQKYLVLRVLYCFYVTNYWSAGHQPKLGEYCFLVNSAINTLQQCRGAVVLRWYYLANQHILFFDLKRNKIQKLFWLPDPNLMLFIFPFYSSLAVFKGCCGGSSSRFKPPSCLITQYWLHFTRRNRKLFKPRFSIWSSHRSLYVLVELSLPICFRK